MSTPSKIGPNSIIQTVAALEAKFGKKEAEVLLKKLARVTISATFRQK